VFRYQGFLLETLRTGASGRGPVLGLGEEGLRLATEWFVGVLAGERSDKKCYRGKHSSTRRIYAVTEDLERRNGVRDFRQPQEIRMEHSCLTSR
jgi:hypothetical protein